MAYGENRPPAYDVPKDVTGVEQRADQPPAGGAPGEVLDGRYRLQSVVTQRGPVTLWHGDDVILARPVAVRVVAVQDAATQAAADRLVRAAVASGRLVHPGAASTYDATSTDTPDGPVSYVVSEWVEGTTLRRMLADGPLRSERAAAVVYAVARVVAAAHAHGVHHGDLHTGDVVVTPHGAVKVTDLEIGAVVAELSGQGEPADDPTERDVRGLGAILYACLTGRWPEGPGRGLPPAPAGPDGNLCAPRQVRAGVPRDLDQLTLAALGDRRAQREPIRSAGALADELEMVAGDEPAFPAGTAYSAGGDTPPPQPPRYAPQPRGFAQSSPIRLGPPTGPTRRRGRVLPWLVGLLILALIAAIVVLLPKGGGGSNGGSGTGQASNSPSASATAAAPTTFRPLNATSFDPQGDGTEDETDVGKAIDGNPQTAWTTEYYNPPNQFGNLKKGVGLVVDMGKPVPARQVKITFGAAPTSFQLYAAASKPAGTQASPLAGLRAVGAPQTNAGVDATVSLSGVGSYQYWVVWMTALPQVQGRFQGSIAEISFTG